MPDLLFDLLDGARLVLARDQWDGAVGAGAVTPFRDLHIGVVRWCGEGAVILQLLVVGFAQVVDDTVPVELPVEAVHLRYLGRQLLAVALRETAHHVELLQLVALLGFCKGEDHVDRFLLGITDKAAGVDDGDVTIGVLGIVCHGVAVGHQLTHQPFRVDQVLGATQRDHIYLVLDHKS